MRIRRVDRRTERLVLLGMIVDRGFCARVALKYTSDFLRNSYAKTVAQWCIDYFKRYNEAPASRIQDIYHKEKRHVDENDVDMIEDLLQEISNEYSQGETINTEYLMERAEEYFNQVRIENSIERAQEHLMAGEIRKAQDLLHESKEIKLTAGSAIDPLASEERLREAFEQSAEPLIKLDGDIGRFMNEFLTRDSLIVGQAPEKAGKTWLLYWMVLESLKNRRKTVLAALGDMTENQSIVRLAIALSGKNNKKKYCGKMFHPTALIRIENEDKKWCQNAPVGIDLEVEEVEATSPLTPKEAFEIICEFYRKHRLKPERYLKMITSPADSMSVADLDVELDRLAKEDDFVADVVVADYMDIFAAENAKDIGRDKINNTWVAAKKLTNKRHILFISMTQSNKDSYSGEVQTRGNVAEDKRKYAHPNGVFGMNQNKNEKRVGIQKLNWLALREGEYTEGDVCYVAQNLRRGQAVCASLMKDEPWQVRVAKERAAEKSKGRDEEAEGEKDSAELRKKRRRRD